jgi:phosphoserine phosphatase RsbU/P
MTWHRSELLPAFISALLVCGAAGLASQSSAQTAPRPFAGSAAQPFDASGLQEPVEIGIAGLVQAGDNPEYSQPGFDDSKWLHVDAETRLADYFQQNRTPIVWRRIHIKIDPNRKQMALQAYSVARAFEIYVNGQKLIQCGQVEPYAPAMRNARLIVRVPAAQLRTGSLVIAIRARAPTTWWTSTLPGFSGGMLTLGDEIALENQNLLIMIAENSATFLENLLALGVGLVALALFIGQRQRMEYFWIFVLGVLNAGYLPLLFLSIRRNIPVSLWSIDEIVQIAIYFAIVLMVQAFLQRPLRWFIWLSIAIAFLIAIVSNVGFDYGIFPAALGTFFTIPLGLIFAAVIPILLFRHLRRGNREAGILLIPFIFYSLWIYASIAIGLFALLPPLRRASVHAAQLINAFPVGFFTVGLADLGTLSFYFSLSIIMVLRATRTSRQQALLEGELEAAREIQQVILPERIESVPGFTVESIYQPAEEVGGDFFQIIPGEQDGSLLIVAGDVAGKGLQAGMLVALMVGTIRTVADTSIDPESVLRALNKRLLGRGHSLATCLALKIARDGAVTLANAGHLPPYLNGEQVPMEGALPLGVIEGAEFSVNRFSLKDGDKLLFMSDGIVEATDAHGHLFGFDRVLELVRSAASPADLAGAAQSFGQRDDISVISVTRTAILEPAA